MIRLLLVMTLIPAIEMLLLLELAERLGAVETVVLILLTGSLGASLAKREGLGVLRQLQQDAARGIPPADRLVEGVLVLIGGVLLITPGVLTDALGVALLIGPSGFRWAGVVSSWGLQGGVRECLKRRCPHLDLRHPRGRAGASTTRCADRGRAQKIRPTVSALAESPSSA
jgi:UPF0716 family protein affecting phage T7 exclusion